jgi:hypothetical protein
MIRVFVCCVLLASPAAAECLVRGTVIDGISGKPLPGTRVFAKPKAKSHPAILHITDASGAFCFEKLDKGDYEFVADRPGYLAALLGARPGVDTGTVFTIGPQAAIPALVLKMIQAASLSGTVTDSTGQPLPDIEVDLLRKVWQHGWSTDVVDIVSADDLGAFTFRRLAPGTYYLRAELPRRRTGAMDENGGPFRPREVSTFYSAAFSMDRAAPIVVEAGQEIANIPLALNPATPRRISGRVTGVNWGPNEHPVVRLIAEGDSFQYVVEVPIQPDGTFSADNLYPSRFGASVSGTKHEFFREAADVTAGDADGVVITPESPRGDLSIRVDTAGQPAPSQLELLNLETGGTAQAARRGDGMYQFQVRPGRYRVKMRGSAMYVDHVVVDGRARPDAIVEIRSGANTQVQAVLGNATAHIEARVEQRESSANALAVTLVWEDVADAIGDMISSDWKVIPRTGSLEVSPLAPGKYRLFAIEGFEEGPWGCPDLAAALAAKAVAIDLKPGESRQVAVPVISAEEWAAALRKIGL